MKTQLFILLCISFLSIPACKKKHNESKYNEDPTSTNSFTLKHNGVLFSTSTPTVSLNNTMIGITAGTIGETGSFYQLGLKRDLLPGIYEYSGDISDPMVFLIVSDQLTYTENHGSITVLSNDTVLKKIEFDFEFEMLESNSNMDTIQVTEGHARISY